MTFACDPELLAHPEAYGTPASTTTIPPLSTGYLPGTTPAPSPSASMSVGDFVGIAIAVVVAMLIFCGVLSLCARLAWKRRWFQPERRSGHVGDSETGRARGEEAGGGGNSSEQANPVFSQEGAAADHRTKRSTLGKNMDQPSKPKSASTSTAKTSPPPRPMPPSTTSAPTPRAPRPFNNWPATPMTPPRAQPPTINRSVRKIKNQLFDKIMCTIKNAENLLNNFKCEL